MLEDLPPVLRWVYRRTDEPLVRPADFDDLSASQYETVEVEVERDRARQTLQDIHDAIDERSQYYLIEEVVIGVERYLEADIYCQVAHDVGVETWIGRGIDVTVVPGQMIEPVVPAEKRVEEHLFDEGDGDA